MAAARWVCAGCGVPWAPGAPCCPSCRGLDHADEPEPVAQDTPAGAAPRVPRPRGG